MISVIGKGDHLLCQCVCILSFALRTQWRVWGIWELGASEEFAHVLSFGQSHFKVLLCHGLCSPASTSTVPEAKQGFEYIFRLHLNISSNVLLLIARLFPSKSGVDIRITMAGNVAVGLCESNGHFIIQTSLTWGVLIIPQTIQQSKLDSRIKILSVYCWKTQISSKHCEPGIWECLQQTKHLPTSVVPVSFPICSEYTSFPCSNSRHQTS